MKSIWTVRYVVYAPDYENRDIVPVEEGEKSFDSIETAKMFVGARAVTIAVIFDDHRTVQFFDGRSWAPQKTVANQFART